MRKKLLMLLVCSVVLLSTLLISTVHASIPIEVEGYFDYTPSILSWRWAGCNLILETTETAVWDVYPSKEGFVGTSVDYPCRVVVHKAEPQGGVPPPSNWKFRWFTAIVTFTGSVCGETGTLVIRLVGTSGPPGTNWEGKWVILSGTGDLANLHGQGTWWGPGNSGGTPEIEYNGKIHFDPS